MRNAVLIVIDTLRRDGIDHARTPAIDSLVRRGELAPLAWSADTWTGGSVVSLFTGRHVRDHGWVQNFPGREEAVWGPMPELPAVPMLAEVLRGAGFETVGIYGNKVLSWKVGFHRGFDRWKFANDRKIPVRVSERLKGWDDGRRHFLYVHFMGPHVPIRPSAAARKRWNPRRRNYGTRLGGIQDDDPERPAVLEDRRRAYWAAIEDTDERLGEIVRDLEPYLDETAIVLTSDHGEMLGERNLFGHGRQMYESLTRVPFVAVNTGPLPERLNNAVAADLLTRAVGVEHEWTLKAGVPETLVSQHMEMLALSTDGQSKAIWNRKGRLTVFDLAGYPEEEPGFPEQKESLAEARARFERSVVRGETGPAVVEADPEMLEALRALGYVGGGEADD